MNNYSSDLNIRQTGKMSSDRQKLLEGVKDFSNVCRICATVVETIYPIFVEEELLCDNLASKINKYLPINVTKEDGLPQVVCFKCQNLVVEWDKLFQSSTQAKILLEKKLALMLQFLDFDKKPKLEKTSEGAEEVSLNGWTPRRVSLDSLYTDREENSDGPDGRECIIKKGPEKADGGPEPSSDDDVPLATVAAERIGNAYQNFYMALKNFRNHFLKDHGEENRPFDFTDSSDSEIEHENDCTETDLANFDDLTDTNMRKDRMDEQTRFELCQAQTEINGKVYYTCKICGKHLSSTHTYIFHQRIHTGERPCVCHVCGKQFRAPNGLQRHLTETHEKQRRYACVACFKSFANSQNLKQHMRIHTGERPFVCPHCGKRFTQSGSLHAHLKTHSEHYPHDCAECGAKFRLRSGLTRHRLKHTGERPHVCVHCGKGFRQRHELTAHAPAHSDDKPHACAACGAPFRTRRALRHHCRRQHGADPPLAHAPTE